ncbi:MAG: hypothetical protein J1F02_01780 [Lachnospiraceae bacterium]|nr:hypothetical protein [Lachnospiraceae bacterium]
MKHHKFERLAEGYYTVKALRYLGKNYGIDLPICNAVYRILYQAEDAKEALSSLFKRNLTEEFR